MNQAATSLHLSGHTHDPTLSDILIAGRINRISGGAVIAPWEVGQLSEDWITACLSLTADTTALHAGSVRIEQAKSDYRKGFLH